MKIMPLNEAIRSFNQVRERQDSHGHSQQQQHEQKKKKDEEFLKELDEAKLDQAIDSFDHEPRNAAAGLKVAKEGTGPGLRVVLRDGTGAIVRQFTGEEFLRVKEAANQDTHGRGKILDQKL